MAVGMRRGGNGQCVRGGHEARQCPAMRTGQSRAVEGAVGAGRSSGAIGYAAFLIAAAFIWLRGLGLIVLGAFLFRCRRGCHLRSRACAFR